MSDVALAEFGALRAEIDNRTTLAYALIGLELTALGAGLTVFGTVPHISLALSAVSSFLWLFWCDIAGQIYKIAAYIRIDLAPRLRTGDTDPLRWEGFLRELDAGGERARMILYPHGREDLVRSVQKSNSADWYTLLLFGGAPPAFISLYVSQSHAWPGQGGVFLNLLAVFAAATLWFFAIYRFIMFQRTIRTVNQAILTTMTDTSERD